MTHVQKTGPEKDLDEEGDVVIDKVELLGRMLIAAAGPIRARMCLQVSGVDWNEITSRGRRSSERDQGLESMLGAAAPVSLRSSRKAWYHEGSLIRKISKNISRRHSCGRGWSIMAGVSPPDR
jgi:hypothetical protein